MALVRRRPRGLLGLAVGVLRRAGERAVRRGPHHARDAGREVVHAVAAELHRAHARHARRRGPRRDRGALADPGADVADVRRAARAGRALPMGAAEPRCRPGRPRRRLPAQRPRDRRRLHRHREPRRDVGDVRAGVRLAQRHRPLRPDRAEGPPHRRRLRVPRPLPGPDGGGREAPRGAADRRARRARALRRGRGPRRHRVVRAAQVRGPAGVRAGAVRPPARRAVLVRDDRPAQGDRARAREPARRALQGARPAVGRRAGEAPAAVHDDRVDDVERARVGAHPARVDRPHRRRPHLARPQPPVAPRRRDRRDARRHVARLPHGLPQGRAAARARPRSLAAQDGHHGRLAAPSGGVRVRLRPARARDAAHQRQRRHRRVLGVRDRLADAARSTRASWRRRRSRSTARPSTRTATRSSASSGSSS